MKRAYLPIAMVLCLLALLPGGCGGGGGKGSRATGRAVLTIQWPTPSRLIPSGTNSITAIIESEADPPQELKRVTVNNPDPSVQIDDLPVAVPLYATVLAFPNRDGQGIPLAQRARIPFQIKEAGTPTQISTFTLASTVTNVQVALSSNVVPAGGTITATATPKDTAGNVVAVDPSKLQWSIPGNTGRVRLLQTTGLTVTLRGDRVSSVMRLQVVYAEGPATVASSDQSGAVAVQFIPPGQIGEALNPISGDNGTRIDGGIASDGTHVYAGVAGAAEGNLVSAATREIEVRNNKLNEYRPLSVAGLGTDNVFVVGSKELRKYAPGSVSSASRMQAVRGNNARTRVPIIDQLPELDPDATLDPKRVGPSRPGETYAGPLAVRSFNGRNELYAIIHRSGVVTRAEEPGSEEPASLVSIDPNTLGLEEKGIVPSATAALTFSKDPKDLFLYGVADGRIFRVDLGAGSPPVIISHVGAPTPFASGIAVDSNGLIYLANRNDGRITVWSALYTPSESPGTLATEFVGEIPATQPVSVAVDGQGRLFVLDDVFEQSNNVAARVLGFQLP